MFSPLAFAELLAVVDLVRVLLVLAVPFVVVVEAVVAKDLSFVTLDFVFDLSVFSRFIDASVCAVATLNASMVSSKKNSFFIIFHSKLIIKYP